MATKEEEARWKVHENIRSLEPLLKRSEANPRPVVLMLCGCSGAGKSTHAKAIPRLLPAFQRLSIDGIVAERHGLYGIDYPGSEYENHLDEADDIFRETLEKLLSEGQKDVILDRSFYAKDDRDDFKALTEKHGGRWVLVYLNVPKAILWKRICGRRRAGIDADCAREIDEKLLDFFYDGFEVPEGEGEVVVENLGRSDSSSD